MTATVLRYRGARALSDFRLAKLLQEMKKAHPAVRAAAAEFWHFIEADVEPDADGKRLLERLLRYGTPAQGDNSGDAHFLVVPKRPIPRLADAQELDKAALGHLLVVAAKVSRDLGVAHDGYRVVINSGARAGQSVFHLHVHVLAGRAMRWPPG